MDIDRIFNAGYCHRLDGGRINGNPYLIGDYRWLIWRAGAIQAEEELAEGIWK